eukprot:jgi/Tetstr1/443893/TSEL_031845.t1
MTPQLRRDMQWWPQCPLNATAQPIHRPVKTYINCDSSGFGCRAVLNGHLKARAFGAGAEDERQHIIWKELKAVRLAVEFSLPHLIAGRRVVLHEDNQHAVCIVLTGLGPRSPEMMAELRRLWDLEDVGQQRHSRQGGALHPAGRQPVGGPHEPAPGQLGPVLFAELKAEWGLPSVDRFVSAMNAILLYHATTRRGWARAARQ